MELLLKLDDIDLFKVYLMNNIIFCFKKVSLCVFVILGVIKYKFFLVEWVMLFKYIIC